MCHCCGPLKSIMPVAFQIMNVTSCFHAAYSIDILHSAAAYAGEELSLARWEVVCGIFISRMPVKLQWHTTAESTRHKNQHKTLKTRVARHRRARAQRCLPAEQQWQALMWHTAAAYRDHQWHQRQQGQSVVPTNKALKPAFAPVAARSLSLHCVSMNVCHYINIKQAIVEKSVLSNILPRMKKKKKKVKRRIWIRHKNPESNGSTEIC